MVGTRRSTEMKTPSQRVPSRKRYKHTPMVTPSEGNALGECVDQVSNDLLITCFSQMRPHIWYSVLPSNDGNTDISSGTRQRWDHMLPILKHIGLLQEKQQATNEFEVFATKWNEFVRQMPGSSKLHFVSFRKKSKAKQFYLCLVDSTFKSPTKQLEAVSTKKIAFEELT